jgi:hypothetical protein
MATKKITLNELRTLVKKIIKESDYNDYLDTNYSSDGMDDYYSEKATYIEAETLYDIGQKLHNIGRKQEAEKYRQEALRKASDWGDDELPKYS